MSKFQSVDTSKISKFQKDSKEAIKEFNAIKAEFKRINKELIANWKGVGADAYKYETDNILEKIGSVKDVLDTINESAVQDIYDTYSQTDEDLGEYNKNPNAGKDK